MDTLASVIPFPPHPAPSRWATVIATATLEAGCGPEKARSLVAGFKHAAELEQEITAAMAYLSRTGCASVLAASRGKCCTGIYCHCASGCLCGCGGCGCRPWPSS